MIKIAFDASSYSSRSAHNSNLLLSIYKLYLQEKEFYYFFSLSISYVVLGSVVLYAEG
jgi:hypothetical protein